jgi:molybdopterin converting factor small subunit
MSVRLRLFYPALERLIGRPDDVLVEGTTVGECLEDVVRRFPDARGLLFDTRGVLLKPVYVFVNAESMFKAELTKPLSERDELIVAVLATGG